MDLKAVEEKSAYDEDKNKEIPLVKTCSGCYTTKTPLWRGGPHGPKSLCNACGIKYNKKRRQMLGLGSKSKSNKNKNIKKKKRSNLKRSNEVNITERTLKLRSGSDFVRQGSEKQLIKSNLREEEIAAILLMALSCESATVCA